MNYHKILKYDTANGPGIRTTIWFTGCCFRCPDCFNAEIQDFKSGKLFDDKAKEELFSYISDPHVTGLSILGGEPLAQQPFDFIEFLKEVKTNFPDKSIWMWTGFQLKDIIKQSQSTLDKQNLVQHLVNSVHLEKIAYVDYLVDGPYKKEETHYHTRFRGSANQIIWHIKFKEENNKHKIYHAINESEIFDKHLENTPYNIKDLETITFSY